MGIHKIIEEIITSALTQRSAFAPPSYLLGPIIAMFDIVSEKGRHFDTATRSFLGIPVRYESDFGSSTLLKLK